VDTVELTEPILLSSSIPNAGERKGQVKSRPYYSNSALVAEILLYKLLIFHLKNRYILHMDFEFDRENREPLVDRNIHSSGKQHSNYLGTPGTTK
jgi:hypothetical protein